ncbi:MAG: hypothetical protein Q8Q31_05250 [Nanoarchaeota archaeon]|nr:hypothetical protein [Nanoarchaeota archaeon]
MIIWGLKAAFIDSERPQTSYGQKFIIAKHPTDSPRLHLYKYFAVNLYNEEQPEHKLIAQGFEIPEEMVLGGGRARLDAQSLVLYDFSRKFGSVPKRFLDFFAPQLLIDYQAHHPKIKEIRIDVPQQSPNDHKVKFLDEVVA